MGVDLIFFHKHLIWVLILLSKSVFHVNVGFFVVDVVFK